MDVDIIPLQARLCCHTAQRIFMGRFTTCVPLTPYFNIDSHVIGIPIPIPPEALEEEEVKNDSFDTTHFCDSHDALQLIDLP